MADKILVTGVLGYISPRKAIGDRATWAEHFKNNGYHTARVSKIFHMGVPGGIEKGTDGADDPRSWTEKYNSPGPEWKAKGKGETLEGNPDGKKPVMGGNTFVVVEADGDDMVHSDGKTAAKACELIKKLKDQTFFLAVGFVRPHVPFVAPKKYWDMYDRKKIRTSTQVNEPIGGAAMGLHASFELRTRHGIPKTGPIGRELATDLLHGYYACVSYVDAQIGLMFDTLEELGIRDDTIIVVWGDHGWHLGVMGIWGKATNYDIATRVPLIFWTPEMNNRG